MPDLVTAMILHRMSFPELLQHYREYRLMTMSDLGLKAGMTKSHISMLEAGKRKPGMKVIQKLATALGLTGEDNKWFTERAIIASRMPKGKGGGRPPPTLSTMREQLMRALLPPETPEETAFLDKVFKRPTAGRSQRFTALRGPPETGVVRASPENKSVFIRREVRESVEYGPVQANLNASSTATVCAENLPEPGGADNPAVHAAQDFVHVCPT